MTKSTIEKQQDGTIKLTIALPKEKIESTRERAIGAIVKQTEIPGFRKGNAPREVVEEKISRDRINEEVLKELLPIYYQEAVNEHQLRPIMNPKIHIEELADGKDWVIHALTCEAPVITLGKFKDNVKKVTAKSKVVLPGKDLPAGRQGQQKPTFEEIAKSVLEGADVKIPAVLLEQEADRLLSQLLADIKKLGLTLDQYLSSTNRTPEDLRAEYTKRAEADMKLEFVLQKIAESEKITVDEKEIEEAIQKAKSPEEKEHLQNNTYLLAAIIRQQKTLDYLMNL
jgi:FKBP-type peptidyl-prolyl cis-trans isomerase (trigger factor)